MNNVLLLKVNKAIDDVSKAYEKIGEKGGAIPVNKTLTNMADCINSIRQQGNTSYLTDKITLAPNNPIIYSKTAPADLDGFTKVIINTSLNIEKYDFGGNPINADALEKYQGHNTYNYVKTANNTYVNKIEGELNTIYTSQLITSSSTDDNSLYRVPAYKMFKGFYDDNNDNIIDIDDSSEFDTFTAIAIMSNMHNDIQEMVSTQKVLQLSYDYVDYTVTTDNIIIGQTTTIYGHKDINIVTALSGYAEFADALNDIANIFGNCSIGHNLAKINTWLDDEREITYFPEYRVFYNINVAITDICDDEILISKKSIRPNIISARIGNIKEIYKNNIILRLTDIIDETSIKLSKNFNVQ